MENYQLGYKSLPECVKDYLKKMLSIKELKPGDEINLTAISKTLGISRTPIREALIQLVKEGLVELESRRKFIIKKLTLDDIRNLYSIVGLLEADASKPACERMTEKDIAKLEDLYRGMAEALSIGDTSTYLDLNALSHDLIIGYCENPVLLGLLQNLKERLNVIIYDFRRIIKSLPEWEKMLMADHSVMIQAIKGKDKLAMGRIIQGMHWDFERNYPFLKKYIEIFQKNNYPSVE